MLHLTLHRTKDTGRETLGELKVEGKPEIPLMFTIERPWLNNKPRVSCIPKGTYKFVKHNGKNFKDVWRLLDVPGRSAILMHVGNRVEDVVGCIAIGLRKGAMNGHPAVLDSESANGDKNAGAIDILRRVIGDKEGTITIL